LLLVWGCSSPPPAPQVELAPAVDRTPAPAEAPERSDLPAELSAAALKEVVEPARTDVRHTCKGVARSRERVEVELTIAGASGKVSHTSVWHDGGNPELAKCAANELQRLVFEPTRKAATRTTVAINF
jgi:hypothetical protein